MQSRAALVLCLLLAACGGGNGGSSSAIPATSAQAPTIAATAQQNPPTVMSSCYASPPTWTQAESGPTVLPETLQQVQANNIPCPIPAFDLVNSTPTSGPKLMGMATSASQNGAVWSLTGTFQPGYATFTPPGYVCSLTYFVSTGPGNSDVVMFQCGP